MDSKIRIVRISEDGFVSKYQHYHRKLMHPSRPLIDNVEELSTGVFVFVWSLPSPYYVNMLLDHMSVEQKAKCKLWVAEIDEDALCYQDNIFEKDMLKQIKEFGSGQDVYIPEKYLKISNIEMVRETI